MKRTKPLVRRPRPLQLDIRVQNLNKVNARTKQLKTFSSKTGHILRIPEREYFRRWGYAFIYLNGTCRRELFLLAPIDRNLDIDKAQALLLVCT